MRIIELFWAWITSPAQWSGADGIPARLGEHLFYTGLALLIALAIALPLGLLAGHTGKGTFLIVNSANAVRALPTLGVLGLVVVLRGIGLLPVMVALVALAIPAILVNTYAGVRAADPAVVDAARGMGMRSSEVLRLVELPLAWPLILLGIRTAVIQIIATATVAAYVGLGGLGRYIFDGLARRDYEAVVGGSVLVVALALLTEAAYALLRRRNPASPSKAPTRTS
ncbi:ABC transporter permease [Longispora albida]|uniref:ABC transporter permease n=1 Tax=Longispora albida TaxID=203523 RepID=UPI000366BE47|nr:ABC transporter permease [Longispora albida]